MPTLEDLLKKIIDEIKAAKINYPFAPIPCLLDEKVSGLIKLFIRASPAERLVFYQKTESISGFLNTFAERCASLAVRGQSSQWIVEGLIALIIENGRMGDYRDTITCLAPIYHAADKIGLDADSLFREVAASYLDNGAAKYIRTFPDRPPHVKSLQAFAYKEVDAPTGFVYERVYW